jgi:hypothetical protein
MEEDMVDMNRWTHLYMQFLTRNLRTFIGLQERVPPVVVQMLLAAAQAHQQALLQDLVVVRQLLLVLVLQQQVQRIVVRVQLVHSFTGQPVKVPPVVVEMLQAAAQAHQQALLQDQLLDQLLEQLLQLLLPAQDRERLRRIHITEEEEDMEVDTVDTDMEEDMVDMNRWTHLYMQFLTRNLRTFIGLQERVPPVVVQMLLFQLFQLFHP